jgi:hypothetical protein
MNPLVLDRLKTSQSNIDQEARYQTWSWRGHLDPWGENDQWNRCDEVGCRVNVGRGEDAQKEAWSWGSLFPQGWGIAMIRVRGYWRWIMWAVQIIPWSEFAWLDGMGSRLWWEVTIWQLRVGVLGRYLSMCVCVCECVSERERERERENGRYRSFNARFTFF